VWSAVGGAGVRLALCSGLLLVLGPAPTSSTAAAGEVEVTTHGTVQVYPYQQADVAPAYMAVHAVQRTEAATVAYLSVGYVDEDPGSDRRPISLSELSVPGARFVGGDSLTSIRLIDPSSAVILSTLPVGGAGAVARAFTSGSGAFPQEAGVMGVIYAVLPPLPEDIETVHVQLGFAAVVPDVPVGDGLLEPIAGDGDRDALVPLGTGWPAIDPQLLANLDEPDLSVFPLSAVTEAIDGSTRETETADEVTVDIAADVLFAVDSADLTTEARDRIAGLARQVAERAAPGEVGVVGHTDSDGTDAYNDDLSRRRAEAVAGVLQPALGTAGLRPLVEGRGEREPVADNETDEGKQRNRRVSIRFTVDPAEDGR